MNAKPASHDQLLAPCDEAHTQPVSAAAEDYSSFEPAHTRFLEELLTVPPRFDEPLSQHTTMRVGGPASAFVTISTVPELQSLLAFLSEHRLRQYVLGNGSNVLFRSQGFKGVVIKLGKPFEFCRIRGQEVTAGGALLLSTLARQTSAKGLTGLEFGCGIPGTVGGSLIGNAGAGPEALADHLTFVELVDRAGEVRRYRQEEMQFSYRKSNLPQLGQVVLEVGFLLEKTRPEVPKEKIAWLSHYRAESQPLRCASAGCVFKNPGPAAGAERTEQTLPSAGALIDRAGLKGLRVGGAEVSTVHANFIINSGGATSEDVLELIRQIRERVQDQFGVELQLEVRLVES